MLFRISFSTLAEKIRRFSFALNMVLYGFSFIQQAQICRCIFWGHLLPKRWTPHCSVSSAGCMRIFHTELVAWLASPWVSWQKTCPRCVFFLSVKKNSVFYLPSEYPNIPLPIVVSYNMIWVVVSTIFYFHPYLGKIPIFTNIFQRGWNHQLAMC